MIGAIATTTELQNHFGRYLNIVENGSEVVVTRNGKEIGRFVPKGAAISYLTDSLAGILSGNYDLDHVRQERLRDKFAVGD